MVRLYSIIYVQEVRRDNALFSFVNNSQFLITFELQQLENIFFSHL